MVFVKLKKKFKETMKKKCLYDYFITLNKIKEEN